MRTQVTHLLVVDDVEASRRWYESVLGATVHRAYGGTSVVLSFLRPEWLLLVTGGRADRLENWQRSRSRRRPTPTPSRPR